METAAARNREPLVFEGPGFDMNYVKAELSPYLGQRVYLEQTESARDDNNLPKGVYETFPGRLTHERDGSMSIDRGGGFKYRKVDSGIAEMCLQMPDGTLMEGNGSRLRLVRVIPDIGQIEQEDPE